MSSIISQYSSSGFYNAPVSKGLMGYMFLTCTLNVPLMYHFKKYLVCKLPDAIIKGEIWRIVISKLSFIDSKDFLFCSLLVYYFRIFERRYGSHKFASCLFASQVISLFLEVAIILILQWFNIDLHGGGYIPPGPYGLVFPLFVSYYFDIPRVAQTSILGIPVTGKTLTYVLGVQFCSTSSATIISAVCGIFAGLIYRFNLCRVRKWLKIPKWLAKLMDSTLGKILASSPPVEGPLGATLELQRQEQNEIWEQQMMVNRVREFRNQTMANGEPPFIHDIVERRNEDVVNQPPSEEHIQTLVEMGFERQRVISALQNSQNDVNTATHILLQQS